MIFFFDKLTDNLVENIHYFENHDKISLDQHSRHVDTKGIKTFIFHTLFQTTSIPNNLLTRQNRLRHNPFLKS